MESSSRRSSMLQHYLIIKEHIEKQLQILISSEEKAQKRYEEDLLFLGSLGSKPLIIRSSGTKQKVIPISHPRYPKAVSYWTRVLNEDISKFLTRDTQKIDRKQKELTEVEAKINNILHQTI